MDATDDSRKWARRRTFDYLLWGVAVAVGLALTMKHEPWRDELHVWGVARDTSWSEFLYSLYIESHMPPWYLLLRGLSAVGLPPESMHVAHWAFSSLGLLFLVRSPLPLLVRVALPFTYFLGYEYLVVARPYVLSSVLAFAYMSVEKRTTEPGPWGWLCLILLPLSNYFGFHLAALLVLRLAVATWWEQRASAANPFAAALGAARQILRKQRLHLLLLTITVAIAVVLSMPKPKYNKAFTVGRQVAFSEMLGESVYGLAMAVYPATTLWKDAWEFPSPLVAGTGARIALGLVALGLLLASVWRDRPVMISLAIACVSIFALYLVFLRGSLSIRYCGFVIVVWIMHLWWFARRRADEHAAAAALGDVASEAPDLVDGPVTAPPRLGYGAVGIVLALQVLACVQMAALDWQQPFSGATQAADWLRWRKPVPGSIFAYQAATASSVAILLGQSVSYIDVRAVGSYLHFDAIYDDEARADPVRVICQATFERANALQTPVYLILPKALDDFRDGVPPVLKDYVYKAYVGPTAIVASESYVIYEISPTRVD